MNDVEMIYSLKSYTTILQKFPFFCPCNYQPYPVKAEFTFIFMVRNIVLLLVRAYFLIITLGRLQLTKPNVAIANWLTPVAMCL